MRKLFFLIGMCVFISKVQSQTGPTCMKNDLTVGYTTTVLNNPEGWGRTTDIYGLLSSRVIITTSNIQTGLWSNEYGTYSAPAGGMAGTRGNHSFSLVTNGLGRVFILPDGNVGIGTTSPSEKLSVDGNIRTRKVIVMQTGWPDYVFDSSYQLPSLDSVSNFIQANKHLPDMPSAATVEKDGHDVGEVQKQLLKKVEELTLYVIELEKKIKKLSPEN